MYENGQGVKKDTEGSLCGSTGLRANTDRCRRKQLSVKSTNFGQGVKADYKEAAGWYRRAIEQGETRCATRLGAMLLRGEGIERICRKRSNCDLGRGAGKCVRAI